ncbi:hypothetical protein [Arthrobacter sp.]|uniref:hypothetical protein n=1 Tax=Arthrobacter sp. TaxID=1667 RepID=UPI003A939D5B
MQVEFSHGCGRRPRVGSSRPFGLHDCLAVPEVSDEYLLFNHPYKTVMGVDFNWLKLNQTFKKGVGVSKEYNSQGALIRTGVASSAGMKFFGNYINKTYGRARMNHSVGNPLCWAARDIFYTATVDSWRSGKIQVTTRRVKAPSHEFYARGASPYWTIMGRQNLQSFFCLNLNCGTESYSATKSVW